MLGMRFRNPIIPGAGPNVGTGEQLRRAAEGGAGGLLAKTVSVVAAEVPRPDMYKYGSNGMLNHELWTELSLEQWLDVEYDIGLAAARSHNIPFLASMGYTPDDLRYIGPQVAAKGVDAIEFTIHYLEPAKIVDTARALRESVSVPIFAKLSPHAGDMGDLARALDPYVDGFSIINSFGPTLAINIDKNEPWLGSTYGYGWLSGAPIKPLAVRCVFEVARVTSKPIIGIGGITRPEDVIEFFMAGAHLVEICTVVMYKGQAFHQKLADGVSKWLDAHGYNDIMAVHRLYVDKWGGGQRVVLEKEEAPVVIADKCVKCSACDDVCFYDALWAPLKQLAVVDPDPCFQCGLCVTVCPTDALVFRPRDQVTLPGPAGGGRA